MSARVRALFAGPLVAGLMIATPAFAHVGVETDNARPQAEAKLEIHVPNESESADTTKVEVRLPEGFTFVRARPQGGWGISLEGDVVTIAGGTITPGDERDFTLVVRNAAEAGEYAFPAIQTYSDGERVRWIGEEGSDKPAPVLTVEGEPVQPAPAGTEAAIETTSPAAAPTPTHAALPSETASAAALEQEDEGGSSPALIVVGVVILLGVLASSLLRRRNGEDGA